MTTSLSLDEILSQMGAAGRRLDHMGAVEAGAGNISVSVDASAEELGLAERFPQVHPGTELPLAAPRPGRAPRGVGWCVPGAPACGTSPPAPRPMSRPSWWTRAA